MFITKEEYDRVNARNVELARQVKDLNEENHCLYKENRDLRHKNEDLKDTVKEILKLAESNTYNNDKTVLGKIKELISDYQSQN